jgi:hypothetical protein
VNTLGLVKYKQDEKKAAQAAFFMTQSQAKSKSQSGKQTLLQSNTWPQSF